MSFGMYHKLERGERRLTGVYLSRLAKAFGVKVSELLEDIDGTPSTVPVHGFATELDGPITWAPTLGRAPAPIGASQNTAAIEIRGGVLRGMSSEGWVLYFEDLRQPVNETTLGEMSVVAIASGEVLIRTPRPGARPGRFHLEGAGAPTMFDVEVAWSSIVSSIIPGKVAQRMMAGEKFEPRSAPFKSRKPPAKPS